MSAVRGVPAVPVGAGAEPVLADAVPASPDAVPGSPDAVPGSPAIVPGHAVVVPGGTEDGPVRPSADEVLLVAGAARVERLGAALAPADASLTVTVVASAAAALVRLATHRYACVVVDVESPGADTAAAIAAITAADPGAGVVVLVPDDGERLAQAYGADDHVLASEIETRHLRRAVDSAMERARSRRAQAALTQQLAAMSAGSTEALIWFGPDGRVSAVSQAGELMTGVGVTDACGRAMPELPWSFVDRDGGMVELDGCESLLTLGATPAAGDGRLEVRRASGDSTPVFLVATELPAPGGVVISMRDSSEHLAIGEAARFQAALLDAVGEAVVVTDRSAKVVFWNPAAEALYGWPAAEAVGRSALEVTPSGDPARQALKIRESVATGTAWSGDFLVGRRDGTQFPALVSIAPVFDDRRELVGLIGVSTDITERQRAEAGARALSAIVESTADAVLSYDLTGLIQTWNRGAEELFGYPAAEVVGTHVRLLSASTPDRTAASLISVRSGETVRGLDAVGRRHDGANVRLSLTASPIRDESGEVVAVSIIARDVSERYELEELMRHQAVHDTLTGLPNRALLDDRLAHTLASASRQGLPVAVLFLDLDQFKAVNDRHGHLVGDGLLVQVAHRLREVTRPADTVARFGGDEFVIVCADATAEDALGLARRISTAFLPPVHVGRLSLAITVSIGIAVTPPLDPDADVLIRCADAALYDAKAAGRARARVFDSSLVAASNDRLQLTDELRHALAHGHLEVHYQPVVELGSGALVGLEALSRWRHPVRGWVGPAVFVPLAEENGLAPALDRWVLRRACEEAARLRAAGFLPRAARVGVNLSASNVSDPSIVEVVVDAARAAGLPLHALELEITETALLSDAAGARDALAALRDLGVTIALDDFGTGFSSLSNLRQLPVTTIKIDRSFVADITDEADDFAIAASVINLGRALGVRTVAEGVETSAQLQLLHRMGCHAGQGYLWSAARPAHQLSALRTPARPGFQAAATAAESPAALTAPHAAAIAGNVTRRAPG